MRLDYFYTHTGLVDAGVMLYVTATGGSAIKAVEVILEHGVPEDRIIFINLVRIARMYETGRGRLYCVYSRSLGPVIVHVQIASPEGLRNFCTKYPTTRVVSANRCICACSVVLTDSMCV